MENCIEYQERISALLDGALPELDRQKLLEHLAICPACQAYMDDQLAIQAALTALDAEAPAGFADTVMAQVRETAQDRPVKKVISFPHWRRWTAAAACCALVLLGAAGWSRGQQPMPLSTQDTGGLARVQEDVSAHTADDAALPAETAPCVLSTASDLARQWIRDTLDAGSDAAERWTLTAEQLTQLRTLLDDAGESYTCSAADSGWAVVLEP